MKSWIEIIPLVADATTQCAPKLLLDTQSTRVTTAQHHRTLTHTGVISKSSLKGCPLLRTNLVIEVPSSSASPSSPLIINQMWASGAPAGHGALYER